MLFARVKLRASRILLGALALCAEQVVSTAFLMPQAHAQSAPQGATLTVCGNTTAFWGGINQPRMQGLRNKLGNTAYFGPGGTYSESALTFVEIGTPTTANLTANNCNIWISGYDNTAAYTDLATFAANGGFVIGGCDNSGFSAVCQGMGYPVTNYSNVGGAYTVTTPFNPLTCDGGAPNPSLNLTTAGGASGYFTSGTVYARYSDASAFPLVITNSQTSPFMVLTGDIDMFTTANPNIDSSSTISTDQEQFIANVFKLAADRVTGALDFYGTPDCDKFPPYPQISFSKTVDQTSINTPGTLTYTITADNVGPVDLTSVSLSDTLTQGATGLSLTTGPTLQPGSDANSNGTLETTETWVWTATYSVTTANLADTDDVINTAIFNSVELGPLNRSATTAMPGPTYSCSNNDFANATELFGASGFVDCSTIGFDGETNEPVQGAMGALDSGWYEWTSPATGTATFDTCDTSVTNYDSFLASYTAAGTPALNTLSNVAFNDDGGNGAGCANFSSLLTFAAVAGTTYYLQVDGYQGNAGDYRLRWSITNPSADISKSVDIASTVTTGDLTYTIIVDNDGTVDLTSPTLDDIVTQNGVTRQSLTNVSVSSGDTDFDGILDVSETWIYTVTYSVTAADLADGNLLVNTASFSATETSAAISDNASTIVFVPNAALEIQKSSTFVTGTSPASVGDVIRYSYVVENTGNQTLTDISVSDITNGTDPAFLGGSNPGNPNHQATLTLDAGPTTGDSIDNNASSSVWGTLGPGDVVTFTADYTVTQTDIDTLQ